VSHQLIESVRAEVPLRDPTDGLNIAQAARARFDVGFEVVRRIEIAMVPLGLLSGLSLEEILL
jgi:hypothetical protein